MEGSALFTQDATYYAHAIKQRQYTVTELVQMSLDIIHSQNSILNAVVSLQEAYALSLARDYDQQLDQLNEQAIEALPPFFGVPLLVKDLGQNQAGFPSTSGSRLLTSHIASHTDAFIQKLIDAGFIIVGRTNTPEFGLKNISDAEVHGVVNSPFDLQRNPGGSSGGAAAALKAGWIPMVTASDGGGSIRIPASFSGLIGLKPSRGRMPVGPESYRSWQGASVNFVLSRSVRDSWQLLKWLQVEQREAPFSLPIMAEDSLKLPQGPLKIAYSPRTFFKEYDVPEETQRGLIETVEMLKALGHEVIEDTPDVDGHAMMESYYLINGGVETAAMLVDMERSMGRPFTVKDMEPMTWACYQFGRNIPGYEVSHTFNYWDQLTVTMEQFYQTYDLWLTPATNGPAPRHGQFHLSDEFLDQLSHAQNYSREEQQQLIWDMYDTSLAWTPSTQLLNLTGQPAISLPTFVDKDGLPIGMQFAAAKGHEYTLLSLALQLEQAGYLHTDIQSIQA